MHDVLSAPPAAATELPRIEVRAKFFFEGDRKFHIQGVTYGPFRPPKEGAPNLPLPEKVAVDFELMRKLGVNVLRIYHTPPRWFLDLALKHRLRVMVTIPWFKRVLFLDEREAVDTIRGNVAKAAMANAGHPAMLGFFIDNEIPPDLVRWYGARRIEEFLNSLVRIVKKHDPLALAAYANFPPTEYLLPSDVDFYSYKRLPPSQEGPRRLPSAACKTSPATSRSSSPNSAWTPSAIPSPSRPRSSPSTSPPFFQNGLAGTFIFSWTDEWFTDGVDVTDWAFGIVTKERKKKASYAALQPLLKNPERPLYQRFEPEKPLPMVSIVVCSYNGARTLRDCMKSLQNLNYPQYEVVFIDDGRQQGQHAGNHTRFPRRAEHRAEEPRPQRRAQRRHRRRARGRRRLHRQRLHGRPRLALLPRADAAQRRLRRRRRAEHLPARDELDPGDRRRRARLAEPRAAHRHDRGARPRLQHGVP